MSQRFKVDLGGLVELLSKNLYSGPQVYLREAIQNGVDAITARREQDADAPARVLLEPWEDGTGITITDTGVGLTAEQAEEFLATIGRTSKRDEVFNEGRTEFLGQFGIGLLACFLIADTVEVTSQSVLPGAAPVRWLGHADGTFEVLQLASGEDAAGQLPEVGTTIRLKARADAAHWVAEETVVTLTSDYADMLPVEVAVRVTAAGQRIWRRISLPALPWARGEGEHQPNQHERALALTNYAEKTLSFTPLAALELNVPATGTTGVAYVLPQAVSPGSGRHRVYVKNMLVNAREDTLLPDWAFFVRAVVNSESLTPTASREQLREDEILLLTREAIGEQLKTWITATLSEPSALRDRFVETHSLALRAVALASDDMLDVVASSLPFETTGGIATLAQVIEETGQVLYTPTTEAYRRVAPVARAQGLWVVNGGYVYDADLLAKLADRPRWKVTKLTSKDITQTLAAVEMEREFEVLRGLERARAVLAAQDCGVLLRTFDPAEVPAVLLRDADAERARDLAQEAEDAGGVWGGLLGSFTEATTEPTRTLVLNDANENTRRLLHQPEHASFEPGLTTLYLSALMLAGEGLRGAETNLLSDSLAQLLEAALRQP
ncbi:HSP90 family protein [Rothia nasimurium]|uniref:HSP90 family protein n=1 Tax=Rothia nasimurium TaxID=85336 RepID=A0A4Y9F3R4_9MICC|nr:HSP90 family protein [Rothia nasimurium]MBF0808993.1 HSP90 family protein [Rothia nasimurium]TFU20954.1 HSP90 family protein [Rothia nasimurium]